MKDLVSCATAGLVLILLLSPAHTGKLAVAADFHVPAMWEYTAPLIAPEKRDRDPSRAQKDPTVVFYGGKWHVFMTVKLPGKSAIEYCSFDALGRRRPRRRERS